jgi:hypothetical protein
MMILRKEKHFKYSDGIRQMLEDGGYGIKITKKGVEVYEKSKA